MHLITQQHRNFYDACIFPQNGLNELFHFLLISFYVHKKFVTASEYSDITEFRVIVNNELRSVNTLYKQVMHGSLTSEKSRFSLS
jgi:hypothetical protein